MSILDKLLKNSPPDKPCEPLHLRLPRGTRLSYEYYCDFAGTQDVEVLFEIVKTTDNSYYYIKHIAGKFKDLWSHGEAEGDRPQAFEYFLAYHGELIVVQ